MWDETGETLGETSEAHHRLLHEASSREVGEDTWPGSLTQVSAPE